MILPGGKDLMGPFGPGYGPASSGYGLKEPWKSLASMTRHVEGHAAAAMRRDGIWDATLYLNMKPCKGPGGCLERLEEVMPDGSRLTIFKIFKNGSVWRRVFYGNGRGLEDSDSGGSDDLPS